MQQQQQYLVFHKKKGYCTGVIVTAGTLVPTWTLNRWRAERLSEVGARMRAEQIKIHAPGCQVIPA